MDRDKDRTGTELRVIRPRLARRVMLLINAFIDAKSELPLAEMARVLRKVGSDWADEEWSLQLRAVAFVIADLIDQGWDVRPVDHSIELRPPGLLIAGESAVEANSRIRDALRVARTRQLAEPGVRSFLDRMHRTVPRGTRATSIADVVDDGRDLAAHLRSLRKLDIPDRLTALRELVRPVIEVCDDETKCPETGLRLMDIWRYFRHTWSLEYRSIPGRQLALLVRNAARPNRPVMGIAMLASPIVRTKPRDTWIGWLPEALVEHVRVGDWAAADVIGALFRRLDASILELRTDDLATFEELSAPNEQVVLRIERRADGAARARSHDLKRSYAEMIESEAGVRSRRDAARGTFDDVDLRALSEDHLFLHKRADTLWRLLDAKLAFIESNCLSAGDDALDRLRSHPRGERALSIALQEVRKAGLSSQVADLSVCGAAPPYNALLAGKLVAMLVASEEATSAYRDRYGDRPSIISSQMAGRPIIRPADLKVLTTTSLYGNNSSQYNRLKLRVADFPQLGRDLHWVRLAKTKGFGTYHLAPETIGVLREVSEKSRGARWVNNRFGEGASPRLRQTREGLDALGITSSAVLNHATPRLFFGCQLTDSAIEELMGLSAVVSGTAPSADAIGEAWRHRWLARRIMSDEVLAHVESTNAHSLRDGFTLAPLDSED